MSFRRDGKTAYARSCSWPGSWLDTNAALIRDRGLPSSAIRNEEDRRYPPRYGYHCAGPCPAIDFRLEELSESERAAFRALLIAALADGERECAAWHFVSPPAG